MTIYNEIDILTKSPILRLQELNTKEALSDPKILANLSEVAYKIVEVEQHLGKRLIIHDVFRCKAVNDLIFRTSPNSAHCEGLAFDFECPEYGSIYQVCCALQRSTIRYDQLYNEGDHVHIGLRKPFRQLQATFVGRFQPYLFGFHDWETNRPKDYPVLRS